MSKPASKPIKTRRSADSLYDFRASVASLDQVVYPLILYYKGVEVRILEVTKVDTPIIKEYYVVVQLKYLKYVTRPFTITCKDVDDFIHKLRIEITRFRLFSMFLPEAIKPS